MKIISSLVAGVVFGLGLIVAQMINPAKIQNFLDVFGDWDPSLALVMVGAIAVTLPGFRLTGKRIEPFFHDTFHMPTRKDIDARLIFGGGFFGIGWGLAGFCPGPALAALPLMAPSVIVFVIAMLVGMWVARMQWK